MNANIAERPTLGVLITYYNEKELLQECLESLFEQTENPSEVLVYDDASAAPAENFIPKKYPIRIIRSETNHGPAHGRNALLRASESDYIHFHDADDLFHPAWCQRVREVIEEMGALVVFTEISSYRGSDISCKNVLDLQRLMNGEDLVRFCIRGSMLAPAGTYHRDVITSLGGYNESQWQAEDYEFHVRLAAQQPKYEVIPDPLVLIRLRKTGRSRQNRVEVSSGLLRAIRDLAHELPKDYRRDLAERAFREGRKLIRNGNRALAKEAFQLANELGPPFYDNHGHIYRTLVRLFGPELVEQMAEKYGRRLWTWLWQRS